jgi:ABC-type phosphate transport system ATPase subunit
MICSQGDDIYISSLAAFFYPLISVPLIYGLLEEFDRTSVIFGHPTKVATEEYISGRFG